MSDEMKLLMALCDALEFEVERVDRFDVEGYERAVAVFYEHGKHMMMAMPDRKKYLNTEFKLTNTIKKTENCNDNARLQGEGLKKGP